MAVHSDTLGDGLQLPGQNGSVRKRVLTPSPSMLSLAFYEPGKWTESHEGMGFLFSLLTFLYALSLTVFSLALEMTVPPEQDIFKMIFALFMFIVGIITLIYFYAFILHPEWLLHIERALLWVGVHKKFHTEKVEHGGAGAGSLYLRLGAVAFGIVSIVYCSLKLFLCFEGGCKASYYVINIIQPIFIFIQMHFIFCNSKMTVSKYCRLAKFGMMHLVAVNLWTWFRNFLEKQKTKAKKPVYSPSESVVAEQVLLDSMGVTIPTLTTTTKAAETGGAELLEQIFGSTKILMSTCLVEYSLIAAAVMFVLWMSIGSFDSSSDYPTTTATKVRRKHRMRVDCSAATTGLFFGLLYLIVAFVGIGVFDAESQMVSGFAGWILSQIDGILFIWALIGCLFGMWRVRLLSFVSHSHGGAHSTAETLDEILLIFGLVGEIVYCSVMFLELIDNGTEAELTFNTDDSSQGLLLAYTIIRIVQVLLQSVLILISAKLTAAGETNSRTKPGKQFITFLLLANITLFVVHSYRAQRESSDGVGAFSGAQWTTILQVVNPLLTFYRFHSSVCLAEVWKHAYTVKDSQSRKLSTQTIAPSIHMNNEEHGV